MRCLSRSVRGGEGEGSRAEAPAGDHHQHQIPRISFAKQHLNLVSCLDTSAVGNGMAALAD